MCLTSSPKLLAHPEAKNEAALVQRYNVRIVVIGQATTPPGILARHRPSRRPGGLPRTARHAISRLWTTWGDHPPMPTLAELKARLAQSEADLAAGRTVSLENVLSDLDASIERIERGLAAKATDAA